MRSRFAYGIFLFSCVALITFFVAANAVDDQPQEEPACKCVSQVDDEPTEP